MWVPGAAWRSTRHSWFARRAASSGSAGAAASGAPAAAQLRAQIDRHWRSGPGNDDLITLLSDVKSVSTFRGVVQSYVEEREFVKAASVYKSGSRECRSDLESLFAAMRAHSQGLKSPQSAKQLLSKALLRAQPPLVLTPADHARALEILLAGYCKLDKLDHVEGILFEWLSRCGGGGAQGRGRGLLAALDIPRASASASASASGQRRRTAAAAAVTEDLSSILPAAGGGADLPPPSLAAWAFVSKMYAQRFAWPQCVKIAEAASSSSSLATAEKGSSAEVARLYHYAVQSLCDSNQFPRALKLVDEMRTRSLPLGHVHLLTHLLKYYRFHGGGLEISPEQLETILSGMAPPSDEAAGATTGLTSAFVSLLCLRGRPEAAEEIVRDGGGGGADESSAIRPSAVVMVINALVKAGNWARAEELFWDMRSSAVLDAYHSSLAYHHVCDGMRAASQYASLALFMRRFSGFGEGEGQERERERQDGQNGGEEDGAQSCVGVGLPTAVPR